MDKQLASTADVNPLAPPVTAFSWWGAAWLLLSLVGATLYFSPGAEALLEAWSTPEYSYGPLVPLISAYVFLRQLKRTPPQAAPARNLVPAFVVLLAALLLGAVGRIVQISDFVAYGIILWIGGTVLLVMGWRQGWKYWPAVLHLVFMLPLPDVLYYGLSTYLQGVSSQLGVFFLQLLNVPVLLDGNIIDLGVYKLQVAEACSGLRYLFPILSFSYFFSVLYRGPIWHKLVLLVAAGPITVLMNSVRIAIAGVVVDQYGTAFVEGLSHFLEGWVIFIVCIVMLFVLARVLLFFQRRRMGLVEALDLDMSGTWQQIARVRFVEPSVALIVAALTVCVLATGFQVLPQRPPLTIERQPFALFPDRLGNWTVTEQQRLDADTVKVLNADDYYAGRLTSAGAGQPVDLFMAWYKDQMRGGTHSPTVCLPAAGWEIASLEEITVSAGPATAPFTVNRAMIRKGIDRMLVYYWYDQQGQRTASAYYSKLVLAWSKVEAGRSDGALVRLITPITDDADIEAADARLRDALSGVVVPLPRFLPGAGSAAATAPVAVGPTTAVPQSAQITSNFTYPAG